MPSSRRPDTILTLADTILTQWDYLEAPLRHRDTIPTPSGRFLDFTLTSL